MSLIAAMRMVGDQLGMPVTAPRNYSERNWADPVSVIARASAIRARRVVLAGSRAHDAFALAYPGADHLEIRRGTLVVELREGVRAELVVDRPADPTRLIDPDDRGHVHEVVALGHDVVLVDKARVRWLRALDEGQTTRPFRARRADRFEQRAPHTQE